MLYMHTDLDVWNILRDWKQKESKVLFKQEADTHLDV